MRKIGVIGGTGVENPKLMESFKQKNIVTPYGRVICNVGTMFGNQVVFISRHKEQHSVMPSKVNYRANIWALKSLGTEEIIATTAVGSLNPKMVPGDFVICDNILDFTKSRIYTFFDTPEQGVVHVDFTYPYCEHLRALAKEAITSLHLPCHDGGVYVCTEGPRFETAAEIKMFRLLGGDVVGMTQMPEAVLAREAEMCYCSISVVTNLCAGISKNPLTYGEVADCMQVNAKNLRLILEKLLSIPHNEPDCSCRHAMQEFGGFML